MAKLIMTVEEAKDHDKWLKVRNSGIGGSDIAAVLGMSKWKSAWQLWNEKRGMVEPEDLSENEYIYWGTVLEQAVADRFCELTGKQVRKSGTLADDEYDFMLANVDRMVVGEKAGLECKTANGFAAKQWEGDEVPTQYYLQCQWYMMVTGFEKWYIACLIGGNHFVWKEIPRNEEDIAAMRTAAIDFWDMVQTGRMPAIDGSESCSNALRDKFKAEPGKEVELDEPDVDRLLTLKAGLEEMKNAVAEAENTIKLKMGEAEIGYAGEHKVTWKQQAGRVTVDAKRLKAAMPNVFEKYSKTGKPTRVFKVV